MEAKWAQGAGLSYGSLAFVNGVSDPFFTTEYNEATYTRTGLAWIDDNSMLTVLERHLGGALRGSLVGVGNAFEPWHRAAR